MANKPQQLGQPTPSPTPMPTPQPVQQGGQPGQMQDIDFAAIINRWHKLKGANPEYADIPDEVFVRRMFEKHPEILQGLRESAHPTPAGSATKRFMEGLADPLIEAEVGVVQQGGESRSKFKRTEAQKGTMAAATEQTKDMMAAQFKMMGDLAKQPSSLIGGPGVKDRARKGNISGAIGYGVTSALPWLAGLGEAEGAGAKAAKPSAFKSFVEATDAVSAPVQKTLDSQITTIDRAMENESINAQRLTAGMAHAKSIIEKTTKSPAGSAANVGASKAVVDKFYARIKGQKQMRWTDAREIYKDLGKTASDLEPSELKSKLFEIRDALKEELSASAKKAEEPGFDKWVKDYADVSDWKRRYQKVLTGKTEDQMATKATAKPGPVTKILGTNVRWGRSQRGKITKQNAKMIESAHKALDELHDRIKAPAEKPSVAPKSTPKEEQWPDAYKTSPKTVSSAGGGGANYTAAELEAFKKKHGIK